MSLEIERRFLVAELPAPAALGPGQHIAQGYLAAEDTVEVRLRLVDDLAAVLTVKAGRGLVRTEVELPVELDQARQLWPATQGRRLTKTRHRLVVGEWTAELDRFHDQLDGLALVEVEFAATAEAASFTPPAWFGQELTGEPGWSNGELARHGRPDRP